VCLYREGSIFVNGDAHRRATARSSLGFGLEVSATYESAATMLRFGTKSAIEAVWLMSLRLFLRPLLALGLAVAAGGCAAQQRPSLRVVSVEHNTAKPVLLVQVTNPEARPIRLQRLQYTFGSTGHTTQGEVLLSRDVAAGAAVILEVPVELDGQGPFTLQGNLTALIDRIVRIYPVNAKVPVEPPR
jgi:hypothetical protein